MTITTRREHTGGAKQTTITAGITAVSGSVTINDATGWPTGGTGPFYVVIDPGVAGAEEKVLVQTRASTTLTFAGGGRGADSTTATSHSNGATIYHCGPVATEVEEWSAHGNSTSEHGVTGSVVGTGGAQTLSGPKTLTAPVIADFSASTHTHVAASSGGLLNTAAPTASAVGDTSVTGSATTYSRTDHKHAREAFGAAVASTAYGAAKVDGTATTVSHSDHTHGTPHEPLDTGTEASPPGSPTTRQFYRATDSGNILYYNGSAWKYWYVHAKVRAHKGTDATITDNSATLVNMDTEDYDIGGQNMWAVSPNASRFLLPFIGIWDLKWSVRFNANAAGPRRGELRINAAGNAASGTSVGLAQAGNAGSAVSTSVKGSADWQTSATTDYVELFCFQNAGVSLTLTGSQDVFASAGYVGSDT